MRRATFSKRRQLALKSVTAPLTSVDLADREAKVAKLKAFLRATSHEFTARVAEASPHLVKVESGVLAGPLKRRR